MTPPPMITTRARDGQVSRHRVTSSSSRSNAGLAEGAVRLVEALLPPAVEVEVDAAGRRLDRAPERPAVLRDQRLQPHPRQLVPAYARRSTPPPAPRPGRRRGRTRSRCCRARSRRRCCRSTRSRSATSCRRRRRSCRPAGRCCTARSARRGRRAPGAPGRRRRRGRRSRRRAGSPCSCTVRRYVACRRNMSKSPVNRGPACSCRHAARRPLEHARVGERRRSRGVVPVRKPITSTPRSGR